MGFAPTPATPAPAYTLPTKALNATRIIIELRDDKEPIFEKSLIGVLYRDGHEGAAPMIDIAAKDDSIMFNDVRYLVIGRNWIYSSEENGDTIVELWVSDFNA